MGELRKVLSLLHKDKSGVKSSKLQLQVERQIIAERRDQLQYIIGEMRLIMTFTEFEPLSSLLNVKEIELVHLQKSSHSLFELRKIQNDINDLIHNRELIPKFKRFKIEYEFIQTRITDIDRIINKCNSDLVNIRDQKNRFVREFGICRSDHNFSKCRFSRQNIPLTRTELNYTPKMDIHVFKLRVNSNDDIKCHLSDEATPLEPALAIWSDYITSRPPSPTHSMHSFCTDSAYSETMHSLRIAASEVDNLSVIHDDTLPASECCDNAVFSELHLPVQDFNSFCVSGVYDWLFESPLCFDTTGSLSGCLHSRLTSDVFERRLSRSWNGDEKQQNSHSSKQALAVLDLHLRTSPAVCISNETSNLMLRFADGESFE